MIISKVVKSGYRIGRIPVRNRTTIEFAYAKKEQVKMMKNISSLERKRIIRSCQI